MLYHLNLIMVYHGISWLSSFTLIVFWAYHALVSSKVKVQANTKMLSVGLLYFTAPIYGQLGCETIEVHLFWNFSRKIRGARPQTTT